MESSSAPTSPAPALDDATATRWFWAFTIGHVVIWTLATWLVLPNVTLDDAEMLYWGREWQWGYYKHPPLAAWLAESFFFVFGKSLFGVYLGARICAAVCFWAVWRLARRVVAPGTALLSVVALEASYFFTHEAQDLNNNIAPRPFWALAVLALFIAIFEKRFYAWVAAGACLGIAMLGKYDAAVLAVVMLGYSVYDPRGRQAWRTPGPYAMLATALLVFAPHVWWLVENDFATFNYFRIRTADVAQGAVVSGGQFKRLLYPLEFLATQAALFIPVLGVCALALHSGCQARELDIEGQARRRFLIAMTLGPVVGFTVISALLGMRLAVAWGHMLAIWLPLTAFACYETIDRGTRQRFVVQCCLTAGALFLAIGPIRTITYPYYKHGTLLRHFPGNEIAHQVEARWHAEVATPLRIVGGDDWVAGNISLYSPERPSVYCKLSPTCSPWLSDHKLKEYGGVIVWQEGLTDRFRAELARFPHAHEVEPIVARWQTGAGIKPVTVRVAIVPPANHAVLPADVQLAEPNQPALLR